MTHADFTFNKAEALLIDILNSYVVNNPDYPLGFASTRQIICDMANCPFFVNLPALAAGILA